MAGGTGLYLKWYVSGKGKGPKATPQVEAHVKEAISSAWADAQAVGGAEALSEDAKWQVAAGLLAKMGDEEAAARWALSSEVWPWCWGDTIAATAYQSSNHINE